MNLTKLASVIDLFRKGQVVANPEKWKNRQVTATVLGAVIVAGANTATAFGYPIPVDIDTANTIAVGLISVFNAVMTYVTTDKIGLPEKVEVESNKVEEQVVATKDLPVLITETQNITNQVIFPESKVETNHKIVSCAVTKEQLASIYSIRDSVAEHWISYINKALDYANCNTHKRQAAFLSQIGHESGNLKYVKELWGPTAQQLKYEGTTLGTKLGNIKMGDGYKYRGRGLIQTTGRYNYKITYQELIKDFPDTPNFEMYPEKLEEKLYAALSAALYWNKNKLNLYADSGDFIGLTKKINGGITGLQSRQELYNKALSILG